MSFAGDAFEQVVGQTPLRFWVKSDKGVLVQISTTGLHKVVQFVEAIATSKVHRDQLELNDPGRLTLTLHITETAEALDDDLPLADIVMQPGYNENSCERPLFVVVKVDEQLKRPRLDSSARDMKSFFELSTQFLKGSGLSKSTLLYCRSQFWKQFTFMDNVLHAKRVDAEEFDNPYVLGYILGAPGTGKSKTALAFLSTIDRTRWVITWIHCTAGSVTFVQVDGLDWRNELFDDIRSALGQQDIVDRDHIVIVDGYRSAISTHFSVWVACEQWLRQNYEKRRLVLVCSMASRGKSIADDDRMYGVKECKVESWDLKDYVKAVQNDHFYDSCAKALDSADYSDNRSRVDLVKSKFYFGGYSARLMFEYNTNHVMELLENAVEAASNFALYVTGGEGVRTPGVVNRLLSSFYDVEEPYETRTSIVSRYAATRLAQKEGPTLINSLSAALVGYLNPSMRGWLVEMWFFASLPRGDFKLTDNKKPVTWPQSQFTRFDPRSITKVPESAVWWKPKRWNEGGYDAVHVDKERQLVRFVQVTAATSHSFKIECFYSLLKKLGNLMKIEELEIYFIFPNNTRQTQEIAKPKSITGVGLLQGFPGWKQGKEWDSVRKAFIECPIPSE